MKSRAEIIEQSFARKVLAGELPDSPIQLKPEEVGLTPEKLMQMFESQLLSRHLDLCSRKLQARGESFYTIGSAGHEGNAAIAAAFRNDDIAFLHYRDAAFLLQRARQYEPIEDKEQPSTDKDHQAIWDMLLSFTTSSEDPISGGRHKVLGSKELFIPPQTSTVASHLPKALGAAYSIPLARRLEHKGELPDNSVVLCSFGDASANHSTAQGAINAACWASHQKATLPLIFICEDNGIGISTPTPTDWIQASFSRRPGLHYVQCDGLNLIDTYCAAHEAERLARQHHQVVFLHMRCVRLMGHAGSDAEVAYHSLEEIEAIEAQDPLLHSARILIENHILTPQQIVDLNQKISDQVANTAEEVIKRPKLTSAEAVMESLIPPKRDIPPAHLLKPEQRNELFKREVRGMDQREVKSMDQPQHMARLINWALADLMAQHPEIIMMGEDIGPKGGVYNVTSKLSEKFGNHRVINTLLDEQSILGLAIGAAHNGLLPIPEIQFLAYVHNAEDQIRGEAATLSFFSKGQYTNPIVIRIAGLGYQKGFGGHFHNDNSWNVFRDIPGLIVACPSNGQDAVGMLRECVRLAREEQRVVVFIEPIALYMTRDLHEKDDGLWSFSYPEPQTASFSATSTAPDDDDIKTTQTSETGYRLISGVPQSVIPFGQISQYGSGSQLAIISYGNGYYLSHKAAKTLQEQHNIQLRIIDLCWLMPLNETAILEAVKDCENILIVDECRQTGSLGEQLVTLMAEQLESPANIKRLSAEDSFIALGKAATVTLPSRDGIIETALAMTQ